MSNYFVVSAVSSKSTYLSLAVEFYHGALLDPFVHLVRNSSSWTETRSSNKIAPNDFFDINYATV